MEAKRILYEINFETDLVRINIKYEVLMVSDICNRDFILLLFF